MYSARIIPCLLLKNHGLVKTRKFTREKYVGDPINAVKIFNEKEVDELIFLDIAATVDGKEPSIETIRDIASECFMPLGYGGGIHSMDHVKQIFSIGVEKIIINSKAYENPSFIADIADKFGSQSVVVAVDVKKNVLGKYEVYTRSGTYNTKLDPAKYALGMEKVGAGEIFLNSIDRDGMMTGYDIELVKNVATAISIPLIACGGAGDFNDFVKAISEGSASAVAAGSIFVFHGKHRAVLISYPDRLHLESVLKLYPEHGVKK